MKRYFSIVVVLVFVALSLLALRLSLQVGLVSLEFAPDDFKDLEGHARVFALSLLMFSTAGSAISLAGYRGRPWAPKALAWLLTGAAVGSAVCRVLMQPRWVMDPDWPLVLLLSGFAALSWNKAQSVRADA